MKSDSNMISDFLRLNRIKSIHAHTYTHIHIYIHIRGEREREREEGNITRAFNAKYPFRVLLSGDAKSEECKGSASLSRAA